MCLSSIWFTLQLNTYNTELTKYKELVFLPFGQHPCLTVIQQDRVDQGLVDDAIACAVPTHYATHALFMHYSSIAEMHIWFRSDFQPNDDSEYHQYHTSRVRFFICKQSMLKSTIFRSKFGSHQGIRPPAQFTCYLCGRLAEIDELCARKVSVVASRNGWRLPAEIEYRF
jgi:hypothetical protein